jgi:DNA polymerase/3'-5' exonuclease PolX
MELSQARAIAEDLVEEMRPFCERVAIAGSIRRGKPDVKDVEIVAIPQWQGVTVGVDLFGDVTTEANLLHGWAEQNRIRWIKPGTPEIISWPVRPEGKYWRGYLAGVDMKLDLFLCEPGNWGTIYLIPTGSADFSAQVAFRAFAVNAHFEGGWLYTGGEMQWPDPRSNRARVVGGTRTDTPEEEDAFRLLGLRVTPPEFRRDGHDVRSLHDARGWQKEMPL